MTSRNYFIVIALALGFFTFLLPKSADAAFLDLSPKTVTVKTGETFKVEVIIDAGTEKILSTDARILYDSRLLSVTDIADGAYFTVAKKDFSQSGKIYVAGIVDQPGESKTGKGTIATITFKALGDGTGKITYVCNPSETAQDSNIAKDQVEVIDIIECTKNGETTVTVGAGGGTTTTTPIPTPSSLPRSGVIDDVLKFALPGIALIIIGAGLKLLL